jgi:hypothetical protein
VRAAAVVAHLDALDVLPALRAALRAMTAHDESALECREHWTGIIPGLERTLGLDPVAVAPFTLAWSLMYSAITHLDHLQDGDLDDDPVFRTLPHPGIGYNLVFAYYVLASSLLHTLSDQAFSSHRTTRLHRLWNKHMLRMASGQQLDLTTAKADQSALDSYQLIAQYKTGATFALVFGGLAALASDDPDFVDLFADVGELYGLLLQCSDDLRDAEDQPNLTLTLPHALQARFGHTTSAISERFWNQLYQESSHHLDELVTFLPPAMQAELRQLFVTAFGEAATQE